MKRLLIVCLFLIGCREAEDPVNNSDLSCKHTCAPYPVYRNGSLDDPEHPGKCVCDLTKREMLITEFF